MGFRRDAAENPPLSARLPSKFHPAANASSIAGFGVGVFGACGWFGIVWPFNRARDDRLTRDGFVSVSATRRFTLLVRSYFFPFSSAQLSSECSNFLASVKLFTASCNVRSWSS